MEARFVEGGRAGRRGGSKNVGGVADLGNDGIAEGRPGTTVIRCKKAIDNKIRRHECMI